MQTLAHAALMSNTGRKAALRLRVLRWFMRTLIHEARGVSWKGGFAAAAAMTTKNNTPCS